VFVVFSRRQIIKPFLALAENKMPKNCNRKMGMINADIWNLSYIKMLKYIIKNITLSIIIKTCNLKKKTKIMSYIM